MDDTIRCASNRRGAEHGCQIRQTMTGFAGDTGPLATRYARARPSESDLWAGVANVGIALTGIKI